MTGQTEPNRPPRSRGMGRGGFTLIEILVALAVLSAATFIYIELFVSSLELGRGNRNAAIASAAAEAELFALTQAPERYLWHWDPADPDALFPIQRAEDDPKAGNLVTAPAVMPVRDAPHAREQELYRGFRWHAHGQLAETGRYFEVTVSVHWQEQGRERLLALTGAVPRASAPVEEDE